MARLGADVIDGGVASVGLDEHELQVQGGRASDQVIADGRETILDADRGGAGGDRAAGRQVVGLLHVLAEDAVVLRHDGSDREVAVVVVALDIPVDAPAHGFHIGTPGGPRETTLNGEREDEVDVGGVGFAVAHDEVGTGDAKALVGILLVGEVANVATVAGRSLEEIGDTLLDGRVADLEVWATGVVVEALSAGEVEGGIVFGDTTGDVTLVVDEGVGEDAM